MRMQDYTWQGHSVERHFDSNGKVGSTKQETWETLILEGQPHRRTLERDGKPLSPDEARSEQKRLDREAGKLGRETPAERQRRLADAEKQRKREFAFLSEIPDLFDLRLEGESTVDGRPCDHPGSHDPALDERAATQGAVPACRARVGSTRPLINGRKWRPKPRARSPGECFWHVSIRARSWSSNRPRYRRNCGCPSGST